MKKPLKIDLSILQEIGDSNQDFINEMLKSFLESVPEYLKELEKAEKDIDINQVKFFVHKLKSPINLIGVSSLDNAFSFVENFNGTTLEQINPFLKKIKSAAKELLETISKIE